MDVFFPFFYLGPKLVDSGSQPSLHRSPQNLHATLVCGQALKPTFENFSPTPKNLWGNPQILLTRHQS